MGSAIDFMANDPSFAQEGSTTEVMDAAVLQAINDGWLLYQGKEAYGGGGQGWAMFFEAKALGVTGNELIVLRLEAEQYGVDYAWSLQSTQSAYNNSNQLDQIYFDVFKWGADTYRSQAIAYRLSPLSVNPAVSGFGLNQVTDPRTSGPYLNCMSQFGYPAALYLWSAANPNPFYIPIP
ncbi:MAG: hypothetical protein ACOYYF_11105 [Chloroflexota bacterium]|nr:hypothetical protein [Chloroflexota bacterium]MBI5702492.1 hypothetical protein [Chloroflexota bacterium]